MPGVHVLWIQAQGPFGFARRMLLPPVMQIQRREGGVAVAETWIVAQAAVNLLFSLVEPLRTIRVAVNHHEQMRESVFGARSAETRIELQGAFVHVPGPPKIFEAGTGEELGFGEIAVGFSVLGW